MENKHGIENTLEIIETGIEFHQRIKAAAEDNKITFGEKLSMLGPALKITTLWDELQMLPKELADLDQYEISEIIAFLKKTYDFDDKKANIVALKALKFAKASKELVIVLDTPNQEA